MIFPKQDYISYFTKKKSIITVHDLMHRYESKYKEYQDGEYQKREVHYTLISKKASAILVDSSIGKIHFNESYKVNDTIIHILPFVPPFYLLDSNLVDIRLKYNLPDKFIFYPAQFWEHKNHIRLLNAIKILKDNGLLVNLVLVGSKKNNYYNVLNKINELDLKDNVFILGYVPNDDIFSLYKNALAMTFVSVAGPTNIPPIESMLLGCPLICSNVYAMPEQVGNAALLINPYDVQDIAEKIKTIYIDHKLRNELIENGLKIINKYKQNEFNLLFKSILDEVYS
jgi:glycosyltransferase involved in cell wall biosynthesis